MEALDHPQLLGLEDGVKCLAVFAVAVAWREAQGPHTHREVGSEISRLLRSPVIAVDTPALSATSCTVGLRAIRSHSSARSRGDPDIVIHGDRGIKPRSSRRSTS